MKHRTELYSSYDKFYENRFKLVVYTFNSCEDKTVKTRIHSSMMRTARLLTISRSIPCISGGLHKWATSHPPPNRQTPTSWIQTPLNADPPVMWPGMHAGKSAPPPGGQINTCENITLPQTSFAGGN